MTHLDVSMYSLFHIKQSFSSIGCRDLVTAGTMNHVLGISYRLGVLGAKVPPVLESQYYGRRIPTSSFSSSCMIGTSLTLHRLSWSFWFKSLRRCPFACYTTILISVQCSVSRAPFTRELSTLAGAPFVNLETKGNLICCKWRWQSG